MSGIELITAERARQISHEGYTPQHDDTHTDGELGNAANSYLNAVINPDEDGDNDGKPRPCYDWPWDEQAWKPSRSEIINLTKAGALTAAEIDRRQRACKHKFAQDSVQGKRVHGESCMICGATNPLFKQPQTAPASDTAILDWWQNNADRLELDCDLASPEPFRFKKYKPCKPGNLVGGGVIFASGRTLREACLNAMAAEKEAA